MTYTINNLQINQERIKNVRKSNLYAFLGSTLSCVLLFLIMWFYVMPFSGIVQPVEEEGIMVSFGDNENAGGMGSSAEPLAAPDEEVLAPAVEQKPTVTSKPVVAEKLITQNDNSNAIYEQKQKDIERKKKEQDLKQQQLEQQRIDAENRIAQQKKQAQQDAINKAGATVNGLFSNGSKTSGSGNGKGSGNGSGNGSGDGSEAGIQGNPAGHGNLGGNSWSLNGRSLTGRLVSPSYDNDVEGKVTVSIYVDENGHVTNASIGSPTTISDKATRNAAIAAASNTRFSSGSGIVTGVITYNFKLK
jgi:TonB family protein